MNKKNLQAAENVLDDFEKTIQYLTKEAGAHKLCDHPRLRSFGYRRIRFLSHRYFMLYRIEKETVIIDRIFHELQDYENRMT